MKKNLLFILVLSVLIGFKAVAQITTLPLGDGEYKSVTSLTPLPISTNTADKPQSKIWSHAGKFWTILANEEGTFLWKLDGTTWSKMLTVSAGALARVDCKVVGEVVHVLLYRGDNESYLYSLEYDAAASNYKLWSQRTARAAFTLGQGGETATLDIDNAGRMWIAYDTPGEMNVRWSDSPYSTWSDPIVVASRIAEDDICGIIALPTQNKIAVFWSNQRTESFGMKTHITGASPTTWSEDELPASQYAQHVGAGFADDHINMAVASDGTLYCAVKTGYDTPGYDKLALLVRRPNGTWDSPYQVTELEGTRPIVLLNETIGRIRVVYTSHESGGDILYKESAIGTISFGPANTLLKGMYNYASSTKANHGTESVIIATDVSTTDWKAAGVLVTDPASVVTGNLDWNSGKNTHLTGLQAFPNPFSSTATLRFSLLQNSHYAASLYDSRGVKIRPLGNGRATKGTEITLPIDGASLSPGLYFIRLTTESGTVTTRMVHSIH
ncbi:T9SS type A sorting domain-containing protein [Nibribacter ruber]|uniref:T9SS type A sorting domain-containing protein n=1 Tax=Nibribacter ruber TaxID=2698458 RepID=A0A6P1NWL4_9BACT|nr:T9SS type A sorting domain-containing protein [Nibribacter ruber]QHL86021.1 T9SS type A sorting domain-containing protein [Nibribacter ruber]